MTLVLSVIGVTALYLLFAWLACSILCGWLATRAGYQEKSGLATGMLLFFVGVIVWVVILLFFPREGAGVRAGRSA